MQKIVLASESPRRRELLASLNLNFTTCAPQCDETFDCTLPIEEAVQKVALTKAHKGLEFFPKDIVIGADTIVVIDDEILGKPKDDEDARKMLERLSGRIHNVYTGVAIACGDHVHTFCEKTEVEFYELEDSLITSYLATKEHRDKAGSYGIQGKGSIFVKGIKGDYYNVVGLPIASLYQYLIKL